MNNVDLFEFNFVDRKEQKKKINDIFSGEKFKNIIWIYGKHGVGKSYFINHITKEIPKEDLVHIELKMEEQSTNCMQLILEKIGEVTGKSFLSFFQRNYKIVTKLVQGIVCSIIENTTKLDMSSLSDALLDSTKIFTNNTNQQQNNIKLIISYIDTILLIQDLIIVVDNFSLCDMHSFELLTSLLQYYSASKEKRICFILCTSHEESYTNIEYQLQEKVELEPIEIKPFDDYKYFNDILITKFNLATTKPHTIKQIFEFCQGYPERLKTFIHMLYSNGGITFSESSDRATWKNEAVEKIIYNECYEYKIKDLPYIQQFVLYIIVEFQKILSLDILADLVDYLRHKNNFIIVNFSKQDILTAVLELKQNGIVTIYHENTKYYVKLEHDLKYYSFKAQFAEDPMMPRINGIFFEYIIQKKEILLNQEFSKKDIAKLLAWHSYYGQVTNWVRYNLEYGNFQYENGDYLEANEVFCRLEKCWDIFSNEQKIIIANCFFYTGKYLQAKIILESATQIATDKAFDYYILLAQVNNMLLNKEVAVTIIDNELLDYCLNESQWLIAQNLKQRILSNIENKRGEAREIFDDIKKNISAYTKKSALYGKFLMGTIEFYRGVIAEEDLKKAEDIAVKTDNQYLLAILYTNKGFHEFWRGNIELAKKNFQESQNKLSLLRIHEISYPLNNLGVCYMMEGEIDNAINCFQLGLLWNQSKYVEITLKTLLMTCYAIKENDSCFLLMEELQRLLYNSFITDISIHLKVTFSIGFVHKRYGDIGQYDEYKEKAFKIALKYPSTTLPFIWFENYDVNIEKYISTHIEKEKYRFFHSARFEPWLVTLNHD